MVHFGDLTTDADLQVPTPDAEANAILQFTSGSTSDPKGVVLPHRAVCANLDAISEAAELSADDDVLVSWLPLYPHMGLVGLPPPAMSTEIGLARVRERGWKYV